MLLVAGGICGDVSYQLLDNTWPSPGVSTRSILRVAHTGAYSFSRHSYFPRTVIAARGIDGTACRHVIRDGQRFVRLPAAKLCTHQPWLMLPYSLQHSTTKSGSLKTSSLRKAAYHFAYAHKSIRHPSQHPDLCHHDERMLHVVVKLQVAGLHRA